MQRTRVLDDRVHLRQTAAGPVSLRRAIDHVRQGAISNAACDCRGVGAVRPLRRVRSEGPGSSALTTWMTSSGSSAHGSGISSISGMTTSVCTRVMSYLGSTWKPPSVPIASLVTSVASPSAGSIATCHMRACVYTTRSAVQKARCELTVTRPRRVWVSISAQRVARHR
jgi:hypothetical protein